MLQCLKIRMFHLLKKLSKGLVFTCFVAQRKRIDEHTWHSLQISICSACCN
ncbi:tyrocidine synthase 3 domain protein [Bacillus atrophaeus]|nr:tyrocidine synthase 3 domain protein [Bacillus atrophaeus]